MSLLENSQARGKVDLQQTVWGVILAVATTGRAQVADFPRLLVLECPYTSTASYPDPLFPGAGFPP